MLCHPETGSSQTYQVVSLPYFFAHLDEVKFAVLDQDDEEGVE